MAAYQKLYEIQDSVVNPKNEAGVFSRYTFGWMSDILATGKARPLENSDLFPLLDELKSQGQTDKLEEAWNKELRESDHQGWYPQGFKLFKSLLKIFPWYEYAFQVSVSLIYVACQILQPVLLSLLLSLLMSERRENFWWVYIYGAGIGLSSALSTTYIHLMNNSYMLSLRWKVATAGLVFKKVGILLLRDRHSKVHSTHWTHISNKKERSRTNTHTRARARWKDTFTFASFQATYEKFTTMFKIHSIQRVTSSTSTARDHVPWSQSF